MLAGEKTALSPARHARFGKLAQPGRTLVCSTDQKATPPRRSSINSRAGKRHSHLHPKPQQRLQAFHLTQNRRSNPRLRRSILYSDFGDRTLQRNQNWCTLSHCIRVDAPIRKRHPARTRLGIATLVPLWNPSHKLLWNTARLYSLVKNSKRREVWVLTLA